jgi:hypothetical protein
MRMRVQAGDIAIGDIHLSKCRRTGGCALYQKLNRVGGIRQESALTL